MEDIPLSPTTRQRPRMGTGGSRRRRPAQGRGRRTVGHDQGSSASTMTDVIDEITESPFENVGAKSFDELRAEALQAGLKNGIPSKRSDLVLNLLSHYAEEKDVMLGAGILENVGNYGFLRHPTGERGGQDIYIGQSQIKRLGLRQGDMVTGRVRPPQGEERYYPMVGVEVVNGFDTETAKQRPRFEDLTP